MGMNTLMMVSGELVPVGVLAVAVGYERWRRKQAGERPPQTEKLMREPGHTLRRQLEDKQDAFSLWFALTMIGGVIFSMMISLGTPGYWGGCVVGGLTAAVGTVMGFHGARTQRHRHKRAGMRTGWRVNFPRRPESAWECVPSSCCRGGL